MRTSEKDWSESWTPYSNGSSIHSTKQRPQRNSGNRKDRNILTAVEYRRASAGLFPLGSDDRSVPRSCSQQTRQKALAAIPTQFPSPSRNPQILRWNVSGSMEANSVAKKLSVTPDFEDVGTTYKPKKTVRHPQMPHTPSESPWHFAAEG